MTWYETSNNTPHDMAYKLNLQDFIFITQTFQLTLSIPLTKPNL